MEMPEFIVVATNIIRVDLIRLIQIGTSDKKVTICLTTDDPDIAITFVTQEMADQMYANAVADLTGKVRDA